MKCKHIIIIKGFGICQIKQAPEKYIDIEKSINNDFGLNERKISPAACHQLHQKIVHFMIVH